MCDFLIDKINETFNISNREIFENSTRNKVDFINTIIDEKFHNHTDRVEFINKARAEFKEEQLNINEIKFITNGESRFINWLWLTILFKIERKSIMEYLSFKNSNIKDYRPSIMTNTINFNHMAYSSSNLPDKIDTISKSIQDSNTSRRRKLTVTEEIKTSWSNVRNTLTSTKWINEKNTEQLNFIWDYYNKYELRNEIIELTPTSTEEIYHSFIAILDIWEDKTDREIFLQKIKKCWNQRVQRKKNDGRIACQYIISKDSKEKLLRLAKQNDLHINETLERLIDRAYAENLTLRRIDTNPEYKTLTSISENTILSEELR